MNGASIAVRLASGGTRELKLSSTAEEGDDAAVAPLFSDAWLGSELWPAAHTLVRCLEEDDWRCRLQEAALVVELGAGVRVR